MVRLRDGMWLPAEGVRAEYAEEVYEVTPLQGSTGLSLLCPAKKIHGRGDSLNLPAVTLVGCSHGAEGGHHLLIHSLGY